MERMEELTVASPKLDSGSCGLLNCNNSSGGACRVCDNKTAKGRKNRNKIMRWKQKTAAAREEREGKKAGGTYGAIIEQSEEQRVACCRSRVLGNVEFRLIHLTERQIGRVEKVACVHVQSSYAEKQSSTK